jgi:hypothetical protein
MRGFRAAVGLIAVLTIAACGGGSPATSGPDGGGGATATPAGGGGGGGGSGTEADLEAAARALFEAFQVDDDDAYFAGLSDACRSSAGFGTVSERNNSRHGNINRAGVDLGAISIREVTISDFDGSSAMVQLDLSGTDGNPFLEGVPNPWVYEDGEWHWANCDPFATGGGGGGGGLEGSGPDDAIAVGMVPTIAGWYVYSSYPLADADELVTGEGAAPPPPGKVYFLWQLVAQYNGPNPSETLGDDLAFRLVAGNTTYDDPNDCAGSGLELDLGFVAAPGDQAPGGLCRAVATGDVGSLFMIVTDKAAGRDYWFGQE